MYSFLRYAFILTLIGLSAGCSTTEKKEKYILVVFDENGTPVEGAMVTPKAGSVSFETKETGPGGQVDLRGLYSEVPLTIQVRAIRYKPVSVKWALPNLNAQKVVLEKQ